MGGTGVLAYAERDYAWDKPSVISCPYQYDMALKCAIYVVAVMENPPFVDI